MQRHHFLLVTFPAQGHINPVRHLARQLARTASARVTISTSLHAHRRMFRSSASYQDDDQVLVSYSPYSDGFDNGFNPSTDGPNNYWTRFKLVGSQTLTHLAHTLAARGHPVTCIIYTILMSWASDVARDLSVPSVLFWVQSAVVFAICHRYFHGSADLISSHRNDPWFVLKLPRLPPFRMRDLPSYLTLNGTTDPSIFAAFEEMFRILDRDKPIVLVNTFDSLEPDATSAVDQLDLMAIGPMVDPAVEAANGGDLFVDDPREYMEWLDSKKDKSVVYVSFGSLSFLSKRQLEEVMKGLEECGRPYLWVVLREIMEGEGRGVEVKKGGEGMVVEWCSQVRVLSHLSIGCFVTHCGWNSTVESMVCGVPLVMLPQWSEQGMNAEMAEEHWGVGVRGEANVEGVGEWRELCRCLDVVMGDGKRGMEVRHAVDMLRHEAREAVAEGGSSDRNLRAFLEEIGASSPQS